MEVRELLDCLYVGRVRSELLRVLLVSEVTLGLVADGQFSDFLLQHIALPMPQDHADLQPFRRIRLSKRLRAVQWLSLTTYQWMSWHGSALLPSGVTMPRGAPPAPRRQGSAAGSPTDIKFLACCSLFWAKFPRLPHPKLTIRRYAFGSKRDPCSHADGRMTQEVGRTNPTMPRRRLRDHRSPISASATVRIMNTTLAPNTQRGAPKSMIQPNSIGPIMPPVLRPIETIPNARRTAPDGAAARTSMSREGMIMPERKPAIAIAAISTGGVRPTVPISRMIAAFTAKPIAATSACRRVISATNPPPSTPKALAVKNAVSAKFAAENGTA